MPDLQEVITTLKSELKAAQQQVVGEPYLRLENVRVELFVEISKDSKGKFSVGVEILELGGKVKQEDTSTGHQRIVVDFAPEDTTMYMDAGPALNSGLADLIGSVRTQLHNGFSEEPKFYIENLEIDIFFALERTSCGAIGFNFYVLGAKGAASSATADSHRISLKFRQADSDEP